MFSDNERYHKKFESFQSQEYTKADYDKIFDNEEKIKSKAEKFAEYAEYVPLFFLMLKDTFSGKYKEIPKGTLASIAGTLLYVFSPIDLILDVIPVVGLIDDAFILSICVAATASDVAKYKKWRENQQELGNDYKEI